MDYIRFILALSVVLGLILLIGMLFRKMMLSGMLANSFLLAPKKAMSQSQKITIIESKVLDARRRVILLNCSGKNYLLLITPNGDMLLDRIDVGVEPGEEQIKIKTVDKTTGKAVKNIVKQVRMDGGAARGSFDYLQHRDGAAR